MFYIALAISFLLGAIPFAYLIPKLKGIDIRKVGSKNPGATNFTKSSGMEIRHVSSYSGYIEGYARYLLYNLLLS